MSTGRYWDNITQSRVGRRRLLKSGAALSVGAAARALIGCGGDDGGNDDDQAPSDTTGSTGKPKPGGKYGTSFTTVGNYNVTAFYHDGYNNSGITVYDRPMTARADAKGYNLEAMEKIEVAEPTRIVMTLKPGLVYQNKAPVNGRKVLSSDIKATQEYVKQLATAENSNFQRRLTASRRRTQTGCTSGAIRLSLLTYRQSQHVIRGIVDVIKHLRLAAAWGTADHTFGQKALQSSEHREAKNGIPYITDRDPTAGDVALDPAFAAARSASGRLCRNRQNPR
jgi:hypothetical protein